MTIGELKRLLAVWPGDDSDVIAKLAAGDGTFYRYEILDAQWDDDRLVIIVDGLEDEDDSR